MKMEIPTLKFIFKSGQNSPVFVVVNSIFCVNSFMAFTAILAEDAGVLLQIKIILIIGSLRQCTNL